MKSWIGLPIGMIAGAGVSYSLSWWLGGHPALWLIDRFKWWRFETGRANSYSGGVWGFTRRIDLRRLIANREKRQ